MKNPAAVEGLLAKEDDRNSSSNGELVLGIHALGNLEAISKLSSAWMASKFNPTIRTFYQHLVAKGKAKKVALVAAMRKFLTILNSLIKKDERWRTEPCAQKKSV